jgi:putative acetyltransferase
MHPALDFVKSGGMATADSIEFRVDDLSGAATRALIAEHLKAMHSYSPPESVHALDVEHLRKPGITFWTAWIDGEIACMGALKRLDAARGEIKSMRAAEKWLGRGVGRAMLEHIIAEARAMGLKSLWLETGTPDPFWPARRLYERAGFRYCEPFGDYVLDPLSVFMTREI